MTSVGQEGEKFSPSTRANSIASAGSAPVAAGFQLATEVGESTGSLTEPSREAESKRRRPSPGKTYSPLCAGSIVFFLEKVRALSGALHRRPWPRVTWAWPSN
jgi:hypothetical protein